MIASFSHWIPRDFWLEQGIAWWAHSAVGFVTPADMLAGRQAEILAARNRKLEEARRPRQRLHGGAAAFMPRICGRALSGKF